MKKLLLALIALASALCVNGQTYEDFKKTLAEAKRGNIYAQHNIGIYYIKGTGVPQNYSQAVYWFRKAADQGLEDSQFSMGLCYEDGRGVTQNLEQAVYWYTKAAEQGHAQAQYHLARMYYGRKRYPKDNKKCVYWLRKSAEQGYGDAQYLYGLLLDGSEDQIYWLTKAAEQGVVEAAERLGFCYDTLKDYTHAFQWFNVGAEKGMLYSQEYLAIYYMEGKGVTRDYKKAFYWFDQVTKMADPDDKWHDLTYGRAFYNIGYLYELGLGVRQDYEKAFEYYQRAIEYNWKGNPNYRLGVCHENGTGVPVNMGKAISYYKKAAEYNEPEAFYKLGDCYHKGKGVPQSHITAKYYYDKAADKEFPEGQYMSAYYYENGLMCIADLTKATSLYYAAALQGYEPAFEAMKRMYDANPYSKEVFEWFCSREGSNDPVSQYVMSRYYFEGAYFEGLNIKPDHEKAAILLNKAADNGYAEAIEMRKLPAFKKICRRAESERRKQERKDEWEYQMWKFGRFMSDFNEPKGYETRPIGLSLGYVRKSWMMEYQDGINEAGGIFDDKPLHGFQAGLRYSQQLWHGFGVDTGLYYEYYEDKSGIETASDGWGPFGYYMKLHEHNIHFPMHVEYRLNFTDDFQVFFYGGIALDCALYCKFDYFEDGYDEPYGSIDEDIYEAEDMLPDVKRFNAGWSFGGGVTYKALQLNAGTRRGFVNMSASPEYKVFQNNPFEISLSFMF